MPVNVFHFKHKRGSSREGLSFPLLLVSYPFLPTSSLSSSLPLKYPTTNDYKQLVIICTDSRNPIHKICCIIHCIFVRLISYLYLVSRHVSSRTILTSSPIFFVFYWMILNSEINYEKNIEHLSPPVCLSVFVISAYIFGKDGGFRPPSPLFVLTPPLSPALSSAPSPLEFGFRSSWIIVVFFTGYRIFWRTMCYGWLDWIGLSTQLN